MHATLAGGVAIGAASDVVLLGGLAIFIGSLAGALSACGFLWLSPFLKKKIHLHDTCGVHNLHGLPGIYGGLVGAISSSFVDSKYLNQNSV